MKYESEFADIFSEEMQTCAPTPSDLTDHQAILFNAVQFARGNGNKVVANALLGIALLKLHDSQVDALWIGDPNYDGPSLRGIAKTASAIGRRHFDASFRATIRSLGRASAFSRSDRTTRTTRGASTMI